jgi:hypothetical protein
LLTFFYEGEDVCLGEDGEAEATITAEDLDISAVQPSAAAPHTTASGCGAEKPAPKNVFYFYQVRCRKGIYRYCTVYT